MGEEAMKPDKRPVIDSVEGQCVQVTPNPDERTGRRAIEFAANIYGFGISKFGPIIRQTN